MIRKAFYLYQTQVDFLKKLSGSISEHIRRALDEYIEDIEKQRVSASQSGREREKNG